GADGALDARTKELITLALTVATRCRPCLKAHLVEAREMGISEAEIEEVVWCAVAMGGAPLRMFYREVCEELEGGGKTCC
ncbi:MAG: carboxymuconolactone decarboxylase family protein, partial [Lentisphaerae bacterium]|nr:carboxymuconolactone decarboxylase family protein [Lentisphaerota bacterium]